jgi:hypothetical protein
MCGDQSSRNYRVTNHDRSEVTIATIVDEGKTKAIHEYINQNN